MTVVVHNHITAGTIPDFKPATRPPEALQRLRDVRKGNTNLHCDGDNPNSVARVVPTRNIKRDCAQRNSVAQHAKVRLEGLQMKIVEPIFCAGTFAVRNGAGMRCAQPSGIQIIRTEKYRTLSLIYQLLENCLDRSQIGIMIQMLFLDIQNERMLRPIQNQAPIALITLRDKPLALPIPMRVDAE